MKRPRNGTRIDESDARKTGDGCWYCVRGASPRPTKAGKRAINRRERRSRVLTGEQAEGVLGA